MDHIESFFLISRNKLLIHWTNMTNIILPLGYIYDNNVKIFHHQFL